MKRIIDYLPVIALTLVALCATVGGWLFADLIAFAVGLFATGVLIGIHIPEVQR